MPKIGINIKNGTLKKEIVVGIDLGTTNSLIGFINSNGKPQIITKAHQSLVPSVIHISKTHQITVGNEALPYLETEPENTVYSVKRFLGKSYADLGVSADKFNYAVLDAGDEKLVKIKIHERYYSPIELSSILLKELKNSAEKQLETTISGAVITVPAYFNDAQRQATRDAGKLAGLNVLRIINEPTAASLSYGLNDFETGKTIAVYDLGGGTFDISILRIEDGIFEVLSTHGNTNLGGDDFDKAIIDHWVSQSKAFQEALDSKKINTDHLRTLAKRAKESLSTAQEFNASYTLFDLEIPLSLSASTYDKLIFPMVESTIKACMEAVKDAELNKTDVEEVVLVGGSTRIPLVQKMISEFFASSKLNTSINPDEVVALGAAIEADILAGNRTNMVLLDVTPLSLGIEMVGGLMDVVIARNSKIPCQVAKEYTTSVDGQVNLKITIYQGEREMVSDNRKLASFILNNIPAMPAGFPKIAITFKTNTDGILKVSAKEERSGVTQDIEVKPSYGLTDEEVETMLRASLENAQVDVEKRMIEETKNEGEQLIYLSERFIQNNSNILSAKEKEQILLLINDLKTGVSEKKDRNTINIQIEALNKFTQPFAERLMDKAVKSALHDKKIL